MSSPILVDDSDPPVQYSPGWIWDQKVFEVHGTRHAAMSAGMTVTLGFSGTGIQVVGTLEPTDHNGQPTTQYAIDGRLMSTYKAPFTATGNTRFNVTFFSKRDLSPGDHKLVITNINGTSPTLFWLDYFLVYGQSSPSSPSPPPPPHTTNPTTNPPTLPPTTTTTTTTTTTPTDTHSPSSESTPSLSESSSSNTQTETPDSSDTVPGTSLSLSSDISVSTSDHPPSSATQHLPPVTITVSGHTTTITPDSVVNNSVSPPASNTNVGAIVGGGVGGVVLIILLIVIYILWRRKKSGRNDVEPFVFSANEMSSHTGSATFGIVKAGTEAILPPLRPNRFPESTPSLSDTPSSQVLPTPISASHRRTHHRHAELPTAQLTPSASLSTLSPSEPHSHSRSRSPPSSTDSKLQDTLYGSSESVLPLAPGPSQPHARHQPRPQRRHTPAISPSSELSMYSGAPLASMSEEALSAPWYRRQSLLRVLSSAWTADSGSASGAAVGTGRGSGSDHAHALQQDVDSGLRMYPSMPLPLQPPPYTRD